VTGRIRVGILFGGASEEREISLASGLMIAENLPKDRYEVRLLDTLTLMAQHPGLSPELRDKAIALQESKPLRSLPSHEGLSPGMRDQVLRAEALAQSATQALASRGERGIDVAFLALHGKYGEDGTIQGFLELTGTPYTGSGVLASALAMDKVMAKRVLAAEGIPVPRGIHITGAELALEGAAAIARANALLPAVVKPSKQGSSVGMSLVDSPAAMETAVRLALQHDDGADDGEADQLRRFEVQLHAEARALLIHQHLPTVFHAVQLDVAVDEVLHFFQRRRLVGEERHRRQDAF